MVQVPTQILWGEQGLASDDDVLQVWRGYAPQVSGQAVPDCGHFPAEEQPERLATLLLSHLTS